LSIKKGSSQVTERLAGKRERGKCNVRNVRQVSRNGMKMEDPGRADVTRGGGKKKRKEEGRGTNRDKRGNQQENGDQGVLTGKTKKINREMGPRKERLLEARGKKTGGGDERTN